MIRKHTAKCPLGEKHKWAFVKNTTVTSGSFGPTGNTMKVSLRGFYKCACGAKRIGQAKQNAPGNDLRDHMPPVG